MIPRTSLTKAEETRYDSAWCEGKPDEGIGEGITIELAKPTAIPKITIKPGVWMTQQLFDGNNLVTAIEVTTNDGRKLTATPQPKRAEVELKLGGAPVSSITVKITGVKKGRMNDSCLTEIALGEQQPIALGFDTTAAAAFPGALFDLYKTLFDPPEGKGCDAKVLAKYLDFPFTYVMLENTH